MLKKMYALCMQGNVLEAYHYLQSLEQTKQVQALERKYFNRFFREKPILRVKSSDSWIKQVIRAYYQYFIAVLTNSVSLHTAEEELLHRLTPLLPMPLVGKIDMVRVESELELLFNKLGYHFLGGVTSPFRGPYIWKRTDKKVYQVQLPNGEQEVTVFFMHDFILLSWLHYATFGKHSAGGWAKHEGLYCVYDRYKDKIDTPLFQVSFLKHEAQHLDDYQRFPGLPGKDLEYRAKLIELIYHPSVDLYKRFVVSAKEDKSLPHAYAAFVLHKNMSQKTAITPAQIIDVAKKLYDQHTEELSKLDGNYSEGII